MAQERVEFQIAANTVGMENISKLINRVHELDEEMKRLQKATASAGSGFAQASQKIRGNTNVLDAQSKSLRQSRQGLQQVGMQINDFATSVSTGASVTTAFNQQIGQLGYAMSLMQGTAGKVGRFLAGPWGAALTVAVMVVGQFWQSLSDTEEQLEKTALASDKLGEAESILGSIFDLTTGKIKEQNPVLLANARAKIALAKIDAARELAAGKADMRAIRRGRLELQAGLGGGLTLERVGDNTQGIIDRFMRGVNTYSQALSQLQNQLDAGTLGEEEFIRAVEAIDKTSMAAENLKTFEEAEKAINGSTDALAGFLRTTGSSSAAQTEANEALRRAIKLERQMVKAMQDRAKYQAEFNERIQEGLDYGKEIPPTYQQVLNTLGQIETVEIDVPEGLQDIIDKNAEIQNSFESIGNAVANGFKGMITGAQSFGDAMKGIIQSVIDELFRLYVVQQIVGFVKGALGGIFGGGISANPANPLPPLYATGGYPAPGKLAIVGERGPELFVPTSSGKIIPNHQLGGGGGMVINVDARGSSDPEAVRQQVQQGILEAAPSIVAAAQNRTINTLRRPRLAGTL